MLPATATLKRCKDILRLLWKYGRSDALRKAAQGADWPDEKWIDPADEKHSPESLADDLEAMGPTFVKLGQILAGRSDLLPEPYLVALSRLQDKVKPFPFEDVQAIVESELGVRISKAFQEFRPEPLAAASLGQVHRAVLRDGRPVAVKVQRPGIRGQVTEDIAALEQIAGFLERHTDFGKRHRLTTVVDEFRRTLFQELDYGREAANLIALGDNLKEFPRIRVPQPFADYSTRLVLTIEYIEGRKITDVSPLERSELDGVLADELFRAYLKQVLVDGLFHADPHPGNVFLTYDGRIALLDLGMVSRVAPRMQENLLKLLLAVSEGQGERAAGVMIRISHPAPDFNEAEFRRSVGTMVAEQKDSSLAQSDIGKALLEFERIAAANGLHGPTELAMLGKTLLQLHEIGRNLDPEFNPNAAVRRHVLDILQQRMWKDATPSHWLTSFMEVKSFLGQLPGRLNHLLDTLTRAQVELKVRPSDTQQLLEGFQKVANRIAAGLVLAALIIGAALLMRVQTAFELFGYPGLAMLCFMAAAGGGVCLLANIMLQDRKKSRH